jgi:hypothetical protein
MPFPSAAFIHLNPARKDQNNGLCSPICFNDLSPRGRRSELGLYPADIAIKICCTLTVANQAPGYFWRCLVPESQGINAKHLPADLGLASVSISRVVYARNVREHDELADVAVRAVDEGARRDALPGGDGGSDLGQSEQGSGDGHLRVRIILAERGRYGMMRDV